mmetsp:Transcript_423/g.1742  ORF Transcript_423/g.1742 Transcript_423/m.1742 type:complete len:631 (-) Transcript_423:66-1958(-)
MFTNVVSVGLTPRIRARRHGTAVEAGRWVRWATGGGYAGVPSRRRERFLVRRTSDSSSPDVDSKEDGLDMDEIWEQEAVADVEATEEKPKELSGDARNRALAGLLDQALMDRKQLERALTATIEATRAENMALRVEIERVKASAELAKTNEKERIEMYTTVEREIEKRVRRAVEEELHAKFAKFKSRAEAAQGKATERATKADDLMKKLESKYDADMAENLKILKWSYEEDVDSERAKVAEMETRKNTLEEQIRMQGEILKNYNRVLSEKAAQQRELAEKNELVSTFTQSEKQMKESMQDALTRAAKAESKLIDVEKTIESKVKLTIENAEMCIENAERIKNEAERIAAEQKIVSDQLVAAAMIRAESAEAQLVRQKDLLDEFGMLTAAKASASAKLVEFQQQIDAQNSELESLRALASEAKAQAISWKAKAESLEEHSDIKLKQTIESAKDITQGYKKQNDLAQITANDNIAVLNKSLEAAAAEIASLKAQIEAMGSAHERENDRFQREYHAQELLVENWRHRAKLLEQEKEYYESNEARDWHAIHHYPKGRLTTNFSGPLLRAFIANGWKLPEGSVPVMEHGAFVAQVQPNEVTESPDPLEEQANVEKLGTVGLRSARLLDDVDMNEN